MTQATFVWSDELTTNGTYLYGPAFEHVYSVWQHDNGEWYDTDDRMNSLPIHRFNRKPFVLFGPLPKPDMDEYQNFVSRRRG